MAKAEPDPKDKTDDREESKAESDTAPASTDESSKAVGGAKAGDEVKASGEAKVETDKDTTKDTASDTKDEAAAKTEPNEETEESTEKESKMLAEDGKFEKKILLECQKRMVGDEAHKSWRKLYVKYYKKLGSSKANKHIIILGDFVRQQNAKTPELSNYFWHLASLAVRKEQRAFAKLYADAKLVYKVSTPRTNEEAS